jgi:hypothetical protein
MTWWKTIVGWDATWCISKHKMRWCPQALLAKWENESPCLVNKKNLHLEKNAWTFWESYVLGNIAKKIKQLICPCYQY